MLLPYLFAQGPESTRGAGLTNRPSVDGAPTERAKVAARRLRAKLAGLDFRKTEISEYNQRYLAEHLASRDGATLQMYARLLARALRRLDKPLSDAVVVDFGGGSGLMSLLAKELGVGTVIYVDVYDVSCADVRRLGKAVGLGPDRIVCGDLDDLIREVRKTDMDVDAMVSSDVIEHIYDVEAHFHRLPELVRGRFRAVYASTANIENPRCVRRISRVQRDVELVAREGKWGHKQRDSLLAYRDVRAEIIRASAPTLSAEDVAQLASATRGQRQDDIERSVREFERTGAISFRNPHPTNTCDPLTGNWAEHLMDQDWLAAKAASAGFTALVAAGTYEPNGTAVKRRLQTLANLGIRLLGKRGVVIAPYFTLTLDA